jgi:hypothetical protein
VLPSDSASTTDAPPWQQPKGLVGSAIYGHPRHEVAFARFGKLDTQVSDNRVGVGKAQIGKIETSFHYERGFVYFCTQFGD